MRLLLRKLKQKMNKKESTTPEVVEIKDTPVSTPAEVPSYDGIETWEERDVMGQVTKITRKINMSTEEVKKFFGDHNPAKYFRNGKIPVSYKSLGNLLPEDADETIVLRQNMPAFKDVLLFKHKYEQLYQLLIPKQICEFELDGDNEIMNDAIHCDTRSIVFGASNSPRSFEKNYFRQRVQVINQRLKQVAERLTNYNLDK